MTYTFARVSPSVFSNSLVAVIGATGFIGSHLIDSLLFSGCRVIAIGRNFPGLISSNALKNLIYHSILLISLISLQSSHILLM